MANSDRKHRLPEPGEYIRNVGELVEVQDVTPPLTKVEDWIFRETTARAEMRINGKCVKQFSTFNDFYGRGTCVESAIADAKEQQRFYGSADVEFVVVKATSHCRYRPNREENLYARDFFDFDPLANGSRWNVPEDVEEVVWSSKQAG